MLIKQREDIKASEITDAALFRARRALLKAFGLGTLVFSAAALLPNMAHGAARKLSGVRASNYKVNEPITGHHHVATYNNYYEFGTDKDSPALLAPKLRTTPWTISVEGEAGKTGRYHLEDVLKAHALEERIYRFRCVEAWSMVVPWVGVPLADVLKRFAPTSRARYVEFTTLHDPEQMPGQRRRVLDWPYVEGLRIDEAMHPLTLLAVGMYGEVLPNQNGAPLRLIVPWKYGFKSIKAIVKIRFTEQEPRTAWMRAGPDEYGFYANVNPKVDHPRWSQARERRLGEFRKRETLRFNGYADQVAALYAGMDLRKFY